MTKTIKTPRNGNLSYLVVSDTHIRDDMLEDNEDILNQIEQVTNEDHFDYYIHAGDVFEMRQPSKDCIRLFLNHLCNISKKVDKIYIKLGNHDITCENDFSLNFIDSVSKMLKVEIIREPFIINDEIYVNHTGVKEAEISGSNLKYNDISYDKILEMYPNLKVIILGHIHKPQILNKDPLVFIPGSTERTTFAQASETKYIYKLIKIYNTQPLYTLRTYMLHNRAMYDLLIDTKENINYINGSVSNIERIDYEDSRTKVIIKGTKMEISKKKVDDTFLNLFKNTYSLIMRSEVVKENKEIQLSELNSTHNVTLKGIWKEYLEHKGCNKNVKSLSNKLFHKVTYEDTKN